MLHHTVRAATQAFTAILECLCIDIKGQLRGHSLACALASSRELRPEQLMQGADICT